MPVETKLIERLAVWLPLFVYVVALAGFVVGSPFAVSDFPLDDSWIHRVYAESFAFGRGFAYNDAQETGATSPLWVVVSAPAHWIGFFGTPVVVATVKILGALLGALSVAALFGIVRRWTGSAAAAAAAGCLFAVEPRLLFSAISGMELPLLMALWLGSAWAALGRRPLLAAVCLGLTPLARPEAALIVPFGLAGIGRRPLAWIALVLPSLSWSLFCWFANGHPLPNTFYIKATPFALGGKQLGTAWDAVAQHGWGLHPFVWLGLLGGIVWMLFVRGRAAVVLAGLLLAAPAAYLLGVVGSREVRLDGYYWLRYIDPAALALTAAFAAGAGLLLTARFERERIVRALGRFAPPRPVVVLTGVSLLALVALLSALPGLGRTYLERRARFSSDSRAIRMLNVAAAEWIRDRTPETAIVGVTDAGATRYFGRRRTIDLAGLNNSDVAFRRVDGEDLLYGLDYIAIFPETGAGMLLQLFEVQESFALPPEEYTICDCPNQTRKVIAKRRDGVRPR